MSHGWSVPLPDFSIPAVSNRLRIGPYTFQLVVSQIQRDLDGEEDTETVQMMVSMDGVPLTLSDLGVDPALASTLWSLLCSRLTEVVVDFYDPRPRPFGELNPRLGCWGTRPDHLANEREDDGTIALIVGLSTWTVGAHPRGGPAELTRELGEALAEVLAAWVLTAERAKRMPAGTTPLLPPGIGGAG
ncbi:MAG: hypothetical protein U0821_06310 [Chloroflexota bacterium]